MTRRRIHYRKVKRMYPITQRGPAACGCTVTVRGRRTLQEATLLHFDNRPQCARRVRQLMEAAHEASTV